MGVTTTRQIWHGVEETIWMLLAAAITVREFSRSDGLARMAAQWRGAAPPSPGPKLSLTSLAGHTVADRVVPSVRALTFTGHHR